MSASGMTLGKRGMQVPMWPVVVLLVAASVAMVGLRVMSGESAVEQPTAIRRGGVEVVLGAGAIEASAAAIRELPATPFHHEGRAHEVYLGPAVTEITIPVGLENPGVYPTETGFRACDHCRTLPNVSG